MSERIVIVGSGQAGVQTAFSLRDEGFDGEIVVIGEEAGAPYQRPPLSKAYLLGKLDDQGLQLKSVGLYADYRIQLRDGMRVDAIDRARRQVVLGSGEPLGYDRLVLATGARQRRLDVAGAGLDGVLTLRTRDNARALMARLDGVRHAVVAGAGFIGLEFAAVARAKGIDVLVVDIASRPMARALSEEMSRFFEARHVSWGVDFRFRAGIAAIRGPDRVSAVELTTGEQVATDLVLVGVGVIPNADLAAAAGLAAADGVVVDEQLRTSDPLIYAVGDCAVHPNRFSAAGVTRVESVQNAQDQARCVAAGIVGRAVSYTALPWFWSDQGDLKLQIVGLGTGHDAAVVRGDPASGAFSVFCFREGRLLAVESVNRGADHVLARRLISAGGAVALDAVGDETRPLKSLLNASAA